jgi:hypothetical protein
MDIVDAVSSFEEEKVAVISKNSNLRRILDKASDE